MKERHDTKECGQDRECEGREEGHDTKECGRDRECESMRV